MRLLQAVGWLSFDPSLFLSSSPTITSLFGSALITNIITVCRSCSICLSVAAAPMLLRTASAATFLVPMSGFGPLDYRLELLLTAARLMVVTQSRALVFLNPVLDFHSRMIRLLLFLHGDALFSRLPISMALLALMVVTPTFLLIALLLTALLLPALIFSALLLPALLLPALLLTALPLPALLLPALSLLVLVFLLGPPVLVTAAAAARGMERMVCGILACVAALLLDSRRRVGLGRNVVIVILFRVRLAAPIPVG